MNLLSNLLIFVCFPWNLHADPTIQCKPCDCGRQIPQPRIIGGMSAEKSEFPWIAQLTFKRSFYCGGTLINNRYILTAAHCTKGYPFKYIQVRFNQHTRNPEHGAVVIRVLRHIRYNRHTYDGDISLIKMSTEITFNGKIWPICLPKQGSKFGGKKGTVAGWGDTNRFGRLANKLMKVSVPIMTHEQCKSTMYKTRITSSMLCAGNIQGGKDSCQGDSGGSLQLSEGSVILIVGIVSWGWGCALPNRPGVYTNVSAFVPWIRKHTRDACYCDN